MNYLLSTIQPLLDATHSAVVALQDLVTGQPRLHVVKTSLTTYPDETATLNLDTESLPVGVTSKIEKYSVTVRVQALTLPSGVDRVQVLNAVFDGVGTAYDMTIADFDPAVSNAAALPPYLGTNSFVRIHRGADGLGPVDVLVNAYIESEP